MSEYTCWCDKHGAYEIWDAKIKCPQCETEIHTGTYGCFCSQCSPRIPTCFGSEGAALVMRAAHRVEENLEWWDRNGKPVLCLGDFGGTPGQMIWAVRTYWGGFDQTDRETARLILRGSLCPAM